MQPRRQEQAGTPQNGRRFFFLQSNRDALTVCCMSQPNTSRWYIRCPGCLSISAVEVCPDATPQTAKMRCELCDVEVENMGRVHQAARPYLITGTAEVCACDGRCTGARGPSCDCPCGGRNHGTGATVTVTFTAGIPRATVLDAAKAIARRDEFKALVEQVRASDSYGYSCYQRKAAGEYLDRGEFGAFLRYQNGARRVIVAARRLKTHSGRCKALREFLARSSAKVMS